MGASLCSKRSPAQGEPVAPGPTDSAPEQRKSSQPEQVWPTMGVHRKEDRATAEAIKAAGNDLFKKGKFAAAIDLYTEALLHAPDLHVLFVNRAMCNLKLQRWDQCEYDARRALELQSGIVKANYCLGVALRHLVRYKDSCGYLEKALSAALEVQDSIKDQIWRELAACKHSLWEQQATVRGDKRERLRNRFALFLNAYFDAHPEDEGRSRDESDFEDMLKRLEESDTLKEADHVYTCGLTMEPFRDPVVTPDGNSYERAALLEHLDKVGRFEPVTKRKLGKEQLVPNHRMRQATQLYLDEHPWGWSECIDT